jgi:hypothetical protein
MLLLPDRRVNLDGTDILAREGSLVPVIHKTVMNIKSESGRDAGFLIVKAPNPGEMAG